MTCCEKMISAIPAVKPVVTGNGMYLITPPSLRAPMATSTKPAINVATIRPSTPYRPTMPATMTTKAPVGPPICTREPPRAEIRNPATIPV